MYFEEESTYHIYNRGNDRQKIFLKHENYMFFLKKIRKELLPYCNFLAYCLMPNHFHFLVQIKFLTISQADNHLTTGQTALSGQAGNHPLVRKIGTLLSSYTQAINKQESRTGSLFQQKTKAKQLNNTKSRIDYVFTCFQYIHQNPYRAGLVEKLEDWEYSSFRDYAGFRNGTICNQKLAHEIINFDKDGFYGQSYAVIDEKKLKFIW